MAKKVVKVKADKSKATQSFFTRHIFEMLIFAFCFVLFSNSISNDYNMDDELVTINHRLTSKGVSAIPEIFTSPYYQDNMGYAYEYRPVVLASFAIEHQLFGDNAHVSHFINVFLYAICCLLLYLVLVNIGGVFTPLFSFLIVLLFAAHSSHTEVVCSIKNRDEILGLIFCLLSLQIVLYALRKNRLPLLTLLPFVFALALMSKITFLPFAIIIIMALILFTPTQFYVILGIAFLLAMPGFFIMQSTLFFKLDVTLAILVITTFLYYVAKVIGNNDILLQKAAKWKESILDLSFQNSTQQKPEGYIFNSAALSQGPLEIIPRAYFSVTLVNVLPFLLLALYLYGLIVTSHLVCIISIALLLVISLTGKQSYSWWATIALYIAIGAFTSSSYSENFYSIISMNAILLSLVFGVLWDAKKFTVPAVLLLALFVSKAVFHFLLNPNPQHGLLTNIVQITVFFVFYICFLSFFFNKPKHIKWGLLALLIINLAIVRFDRIVPTIFVMVILYGLLWMFISKSSIQLQRYLWLIVTTAAISFMLMRSPSLHSARINTQINTVNVGLHGLDTLANVNFVEIKQNRPVSFVEQPVAPSDPWTIKAGTSLVVLFHYFTKVIVPYPMAFYYGYKFIKPEKITDAVPLLSLGIYMLLLVLLVYFLKYNKTVSFGIGIYLISIAGFSNYFVFVPGIIADRFLLSASLGWCIVIVVALLKIFKVNTLTDKLKLSDLPKGFRYAFIFILSFYSLITFSRNFDWKDYVTLSKHDISYVENSSQANNLLAIYLMKKSYDLPDPATQRAYREEALEHFKKAVEIYPAFYNPTYDIARTYNILNQNDSSIAYFKKALAIDSTNPTPALRIGQMLNERAQYAEAIPYLQYATKHTIGDYEPFDKLSFAYFKLNNYNQSIATNLAAIARLTPQPAPFINIAHVYMAINQMDSARIYLQKALAFNPGDPMVQQLLQQTGLPK